jgi:hypothetical protein
MHILFISLLQPTNAQLISQQYLFIQGVWARGIQKYMLINMWQELEYHLDICQATTGAHIEVYGCA